MKILHAAALCLLTASPALAGNITIDFEQPSSFASIDQFYNGGTDSNGVAGGSSVGVTFGLDDLAVQNDVLGPYFSNAPSPIGLMSAVGPETAMNVEHGFTDVSLFYATPEDVAAGVQVWSGLNGTGTLLASFDLTKNSDPAGSANPYGTWTQVFGGSWSSTAHSVTFVNSVGFAGFDDISVSTPVPEPTTAMLAVLGIAGLVVARRRVGTKE